VIEKTVLEKLSGELSEKEREDLFLRIRRQITSTEEDIQDVELKTQSEEVRKKILAAEMAKMGWLERLIIALSTYFSGKKREEVFIQHKLKGLRRVISRKAPGITGFETRNLTPALAQEVWEIYKTSLLSKKFFQYLWQTEGNYEKAVVYLLVQRIREPRYRLADFLSMDEMVLIYGEYGQKEAVRKEILSRLMGYVEGIADQEVAEAEAALEPFFYLRETVLFPYVGFFQLFGFNPAAMPEVKDPFFQNAAAMLALRFLEKLHGASEYNRMIREPMKIDPGFLRYLLSETRAVPEKAEVREGEAVPQEETIPEIVREEEMKTAVNDLSELHRKLSRFHRGIPVLELIRYFQKDPYLDVSPRIPSLHFREFYYMILKDLLLTEMEELFPEIRRKYIQQELDALFAGKTVYTLQNYRKYASIDYDKMGLPFFRHTQSINLLYNYVKSFYRDFYYDTFQLLNRNILVNNRLTRERLEKYIGSFEETEQRIRDFDFSMSPDSEDGKLFQRLRFSLASDPSHQKMFSSLILQKDREVKLILDRGDEDITGLIKLIDELISSPSQTIKVQLNTHYIVRSKSVMLLKLLSSRRDHLVKFRNILGQIIKEERL